MYGVLECLKRRLKIKGIIIIIVVVIRSFSLYIQLRELVSLNRHIFLTTLAVEQQTLKNQIIVLFKIFSPVGY